jgi:hypothetical protein
MGAGTRIMDIQAKAESVMRCVRLGMALEEAYLLAECSLEEQDSLGRDEAFLYRVQVQRSIQERDLLQKLNTIIELNASMGKGEDLRWLLSRINRKRYGDGKAEDAPSRPEGNDPLSNMDRMEAFKALQAEASRANRSQ